MLVRFTDTKDKTVWINPVHVKMLAVKKPEVTSIAMQVPVTWPINVRVPIDEVAAMLNAAMPMDPYAGITDDAGLGSGSDGGAGVAVAVAMM